MDMKEKIKSVVTDTIDFFIDSELTEWPPGCTSVYGQPERSYKTEDINTNKEKMLNE